MGADAPGEIEIEFPDDPHVWREWLHGGRCVPVIDHDFRGGTGKIQRPAQKLVFIDAFDLPVRAGEFDPRRLDRETERGRVATDRVFNLDVMNPARQGDVIRIVDTQGRTHCAIDVHAAQVEPLARCR